MSSRGTDVLATGLGHCEGPLLRSAGGLLVGSMSEACIFAVSDGDAQVWARTGGGVNGLAEWLDGSVYVAQLGWRSFVRPENYLTGGIQVVSDDRTVAWVTQDPVAPNDLCFGPDGLLYVTDPTRRPWEDGRLWRCDIETGTPELLTSIPWYPNGIAFGVEDDAIYVASTTGREVLRFPLDATLGKPDVFAVLPYGRPDGMAFDVAGNLVVCAVTLDDSPGEVQVFDGNGRLLERMRLGASSLYTNIALGSDGTAFITDTDAGQVLRITDWAEPGLLLHPFRGTSSTGT
jgi:gluconolactonase